MSIKPNPVAEEPRGIELNEAHYPRRAPIDAYGRGGFRFAGMSHRGSLICVPSGIYAWEPATSGIVTITDLERVARETDGIDVLLLGTGNDPVAVPDAIRAFAREHGMVVEAMATGAAVRTFNVLLGDERSVAAALMAVD